MKHWQETRAVVRRLASLAPGEAAALATVVRVRGSAYRHAGAKLLVTATDVIGQVSGGCLEQDVRAVARHVRATGRAERRTWCGGADEVAAWDLGVGCDGEVEVWIRPVAGAWPAAAAALDGRDPVALVTPLDVDAATPPVVSRDPDLLAGGSRIEGTRFVDVLTPPPRLLIVGAGDDAQPLARLAAEVGLCVTVADRRPGLLAPARWPPDVTVVEATADALVTAIAPGADTFAVVMTHHYADDLAYVAALLDTAAPYVGVLGPRRRTERLLAAIAARQPVDDARVFGPVGLDIGTDGAEQVALAIVAEVLAVHSGRPARSLRERTAPIHAGA